MKFIKQYNEINREDALRSRVRSYLRNLTLTGLSKIYKLNGIEVQLQKPRIQFLYIHHVFEDEEKKLELLINKFSEHHTFISYSNAVEKILNRDIDESYIVISSDDGFKNNLRAGKILKKYGIKACFFINPSIVGVNDYEQIKNYCRQKINFPPVEFLGWDDINQLQKMGHEIGSHTMNHINIANTPQKKVKEDIEKSFETISDKCGNVSHFAFPYGRFFHFNEAGRKVVFETGFDSCASAERGCHINHNDDISKERLCIRRDHVVLDWDIDHILFFIARNAKKTNVNNNLFPYSRE